MAKNGCVITIRLTLCVLSTIYATKCHNYIVTVLQWHYYRVNVLQSDITTEWQYNRVTVLQSDSTTKWQYYNQTVLQSDSTTKWQYYNQTVLLCAITTEDLCCYQLSPPPAGLKPHLLLLPPVSFTSSSLYSINQGSLDWHINRPGAVLPSPPSLIHWLSEWLPYTPTCTSRSASYLKNIITTSFGSHQKEKYFSDVALTYEY